MTIKEVLARINKDAAAIPEERRDSYLDSSLSLLEVWSNTSAIGYMIAAAQQMGMSQYDIKQLIRGIEIELDRVSVDKAHRIYCDFERDYAHPDCAE